MKKSDEALALAERIASEEETVIVSDIFYPLMDRLSNSFSDTFFVFDDGHGREHRVIALCWYATLLKDEGK